QQGTDTMFSPSRRACLMAALLAALAPLSAYADDLVNVVKRIKPAVVAVGTFEQTRSPSVDFRGTGFAVGDGLSVITNAHVLPPALNTEQKEMLGIITGEGANPTFRVATVAGIGPEEELARPRMSGPALPTLAVPG